MSTPTLLDVLLAELAKNPAALDTLAEQLAPRLANLRPLPQPGGWVDTHGAAEYLGLTVDAIHKHTAARTIPFEQDTPGGKCWFLRSELDAWRRGEHPHLGSIHGSTSPQHTAAKPQNNGHLHPVNTASGGTRQ